jgi:lysophospholipase L1-like esterase
MRESPGRGFQLAALLLGVAAALVLGEVALRWLRPPQLARIRYPCIYAPDPTLGFRYLPNARGVVAGHFEIHNPVETNSLGFYDEEPLAPERSGTRIVAVGDSFTAAMNVPRQEAWTSVLERELRARGHERADVVNLGLDGTGTDVHVAVLREWLPRLRPDVVLLAFFANDFDDVLNGRFTRECHRGYVLSYQSELQRERLRARVDDHLERRLRRALHRHVYLVRLASLPFLSLRSPYRIEFLQPRRAELGIGEASRRRRLADWREALAELEAIAAGCRCRLLVAPVPPRSRAEGSLATWRRRAGERALELADPLPAIERMRREQGLEHEDLYFVHDNHLNAAGNALYGRALAELLEGERGGRAGRS